LILGVISTFAQAPQAAVEIAKNSPENEVKRSSAVMTADEKEVTTPAEPVIRRNTPILRRVGVDNQQATSLTLAEAINMALQNNNDIEVSRQLAKESVHSLRRLFGLYDPVFTINPNYTDSVQPVSSIFAGGDSTGSFGSKTFRVDSGLTHFIKPGGGNYSV